METAQYTEQNETYRLRKDSLKKTNLFFLSIGKPKEKLPTLFPKKKTRNKKNKKQERTQRDKDKGNQTLK